MIRAELRTIEAAVADTERAEAEFDHARRWLAGAVKGPMDPLAAEVWVTDPTFSCVLLVKHRWRGWVPPGGKVDWGETPREAAARELREETGIHASLFSAPAAVTVRSYRADWQPTLGLSYAAVVERSTPVIGERGQPAAWTALEEEWDGVFPEDRERIRRHVHRLGQRVIAEAG